MRELVGKIVHGFFIGVGFSFALGITYYYITQKLTEDAMGAYGFEEDTIELVKHKKIERDGKLLILGEAYNAGDDKAKGVNVIVDLYNGEEFVKQCDKSVTGGIPAGESRNFEILCGGCKNNPIVEHDSYEIYISGY